MKLIQLVVTVSGVGQFPIDMLRYDNLKPYSETDAGLISRSLTGPFDPNRQTVKLFGHLHGSEGGPSRVTNARWKSFCWAVESVTIDGKPQLIR